MWRHLANIREMKASAMAVERFNQSQHRWKIVQENIPEASYTQLITAAAKAEQLPCVIDLDQPLVPNFAWNQFLRPLDGLIDARILDALNSSGKGTYQGKTYSVGQFDAALALFTRKSLLKKIGVRTPTLTHPWSKDEFMEVLDKIKATRTYQYPFDIRSNDMTEWLPYALSPMMLSWGADLINRNNYVEVNGILNSPKAIEFGHWLYSLVTNHYIERHPADDKGLLTGRVAIQYHGSWAVGEFERVLGDDLAILPVPDFGHGPVIGGGSWQWAVTTDCPYPEGAKAFLTHMVSTKEIATVSISANAIPTLPAATSLTQDFAPNGKWRIFYEFSARFAKVRPETPAYAVISSSYKKAINAILDGEDPQIALDYAVDNIEAAIEHNKGYGFPLPVKSSTP
ncbi:extracellular solute-binding protein [Vibrio mangrovi]|nr:extracellular solute-binding protein [Vibrio mangrovi]MDW6005330.1 extracellular solute-binding protein [Vibrio mangrovi]